MENIEKKKQRLLHNKDKDVNTIYVANIVDNTIVDGEGFRTSLYVSGCDICCVDCHNKELWDINTGTEMSVDEVFKKIINDIVKVLRWQKNSIIIISQYDVIFNEYKNSKKNKKNILDLNTINDECRKEIKKNIKKRIGNNFDENKIFFSSCEYSDDIKEVMDKCNEEILNKIELIAQEKSYPILSKNIIKASTNFAHLILYSFTGLAQNNSAIIPSNFKKDYKKEQNKRNE